MMEFGYRGFGRIKPNYISVYGEQLEITECYQAEKYGFFQLVVNGLFADWQTWCLGRADTKKWYGYADSGSDSSGYAQWNEYSIFTNADVGNVIPMWLAVSPPPLVRRSVRSRWPWSDWLARIATFTERWHNASKRIVKTKRSNKYITFTHKLFEQKINNQSLSNHRNSWNSIVWTKSRILWYIYGIITNQFRGKSIRRVFNSFFSSQPSDFDLRQQLSGRYTHRQHRHHIEIQNLTRRRNGVSYNNARQIKCILGGYYA